MPSLKPASVLRRLLSTPAWTPVLFVALGLTASAAARADITVAPVPFGGTVINDAGPDYDFSFNASFSSDGSRVYFSRAKKDWSKIAVFSADRLGDGWSAARPVALGDGSSRDTDPLVSPSGSLLYFSSDRPVPGASTVSSGYHVWVARKQGLRWGTPELLGGDLDGALFPAVTTNGDLYFTRQQGAGSALFHAVLKAADAVDVQPLHIAGAEAGQDETVSRDNRVFAFVAPDAAGGKAIFLAHHDKGGWSTPEKLALGNGIRNPFALGLSPDGGTLYFTASQAASTTPQIFSAPLPPEAVGGATG
jgi:Tol biopolymer transport system component